MNLHIDFETYCSLDLAKVGAYNYTEHDSFEILLMAYKIDRREVEIVDLTTEQLPEFIAVLLFNCDVKILAHNANFERLCLKNGLGIDIPAERFECSMVKAAYCGLPLDLDRVSSVLRLDQTKAAGAHLINYFCKPCKPTKTNGGRTRNLPEHAPAKWAEFIEYCKQDVRTESAIVERLAKYKLPAQEKDLYCLDQRINDRGVKVERELVINAIEINDVAREHATARYRDITNIDKPNSLPQFKRWLSERLGYAVEDATKSAVTELLTHELGKEVRDVLIIRQLLGKTSIAKYVAMLNIASPYNDIARGLFQFYGANRTGRWAGRAIQLQNLPQNHFKGNEMQLCREALIAGEYDFLELLFSSVPAMLSQLIRAAFIPYSADEVFHVADYSAIEARVISWLAGEKWRMDVFATTGKIYEASAARMFKVPVESISKDSEERKKGKVAELALGYQGGVGALDKMGAEAMGLSEKEKKEIVRVWRAASPSIVQMWGAFERAAVKSVRELTIVQTEYKGVVFACDGECLTIQLPSKRKLHYYKPRLATNAFGNEGVQYYTLDQEKKTWGLTDTYGGKLTENIVQAISRDILAQAMLRLDGAGYKIAIHVHDEVVVSAPRSTAKHDLDDICEIMSQPVSWAQGLILTADGFTTDYYKKD